MANKDNTNREIGNFYEPYRRKQRERAQALETLAKHKQEQKEFEKFVDKGEAIKIVTIDKAMRMTRVHYERLT